METKQVMMTNVSSLPLSVVLNATYPFQLLVEDPRWAPVNIKSSQSVSLVIKKLLRATRHTGAKIPDSFLSHSGIFSESF